MANSKKQFVYYDPESDVISFYSGKGKEEEFIEVAPNISLELNKKGDVIGVEILNASKVLRPFLRSFRRKEISYVR